MPVVIPNSHCDLVSQPIHGVLTTMMPDGQPQSSIVWVDCDGGCLLVNTTLERQKGRNMSANPNVTLLVIDPQNGSRWLEVRGDVIAITQDGAEAHAERLTALYTGKRHFYGDIYPITRREQETRVIVVIEPVKISADAIFK